MKSRFKTNSVRRFTITLTSACTAVLLTFAFTSPVNAEDLSSDPQDSSSTQNSDTATGTETSNDTSETQGTDDNNPTAEPSPTPSSVSAKASTTQVTTNDAQLVANKATLIMHASGDRVTATTSSPLAGVTFSVYDSRLNSPPTASTPVVATCTTDGTGTCSVDVDPRSGGGNNPNGYWIVQTAQANGWFANTTLDVGDSTPTATPYRFHTGNVSANTSYDFPEADGGGSTNSSGINAVSRVNPSVPQQCGIKIAVLVDLSASIGSNITNLRNAAKGFVTALTGTPSQMAVYTFAGGVPASGTTNLSMRSLADSSIANNVKTHIDGLNVVNAGDWRQGTNWDQGIWQIAQSSDTYDLVLVLTDGNPTFYGPEHSGPGSNTRFSEIENAVFSANALKAKGTKIIAVGIGSGVAGSTDNLKAISGTAAGSDYFTTSFTDLESNLRDLAAGACNGTISVVKKVIASNGTIDDAQTASGWQFSTTTSNITPTKGTTNETGSVNFDVGFIGGTNTRDVAIHETSQVGYSLYQVEGKNAVCLADGKPVTVTNDGSDGFTVTASANSIYTCTVYNKQAPSAAQVTIHKTWIINGTTYSSTDPNLPAGMEAELSLTNQNAPVFGETYDGYVQGGKVTIGESATVPQGCSNIPSGDLGEKTLSAGSNTFSIVNTVTCDTRLTLVKNVEGDYPDPATAWTLTAHSPLQSLEGPTGGLSVTDVAVVPGTYELSESGPTQGYSTSEWSCTVGDADLSVIEGAVGIPLGAHVTCTITNTAWQTDLGIVKTHIAGGDENPETFAVDEGTEFSYRLTVTNHSEHPATGFVITDDIPTDLSVQEDEIVLPPGLSYTLTDIESDGSGGHLTITANAGTSLAAGASIVIDIPVTMGQPTQPNPDVAVPDIVNTACVTSAQRDSNTENNCSEDSVRVKSIVLSALAVCRSNTPWLDYDITAVNYDPETFTINWWNPDVWNDGHPTGSPSKTTTIPLDELSGSLLWPGAVLDNTGKIVQWPGWRNGGTIKDPSAPGGDLVPRAIVQITSNPSVTAVQVYPPKSPNCDANPPEATQTPTPTPTQTSTPAVTSTSTTTTTTISTTRPPSSLATTGSPAIASLIAALLMLAGGTLLWRRRTH